MNYQEKSFANFSGLADLSPALLENHLTLYKGYVTNTNKLSDLLKSMESESKTTTPEYAEIKRRFGWEWNGMRLHELYFENVSTDTTEPQSDIKDMLTAEFGSVEAWSESFRAMGTMRGIGWVILYYDVENNRLFNQWINEHDVSHLSGLKPLLVMDVFEHAFMLDFGLKRADYVNFFMTHINWSIVSGRI